MTTTQARTSTTEERGLLGCSLGAAEPHVFCIEWNAEDQLTRVTKNSVEQARFKYDPIGRRVEKVAGWTHDDEDVLRQVAGSGTVKCCGAWREVTFRHEAAFVERWNEHFRR